MPRAKRSPIAPIETLSIHTNQDGEVTVEVYADQYSYGKRGEHRTWLLQDKVIKMCVDIVEKDIANDQPIDYLRYPMKFAYRCLEVFGEDNDKACNRLDTYRKKVHKETLKNLQIYFNAIETQHESERNDLAISFHRAFKNIIEK